MSIVNPLNKNDEEVITRITDDGMRETIRSSSNIRGFVLAPETTKHRTWREYINFRITNSTITRYWYYSDLEPDDANALVTTAFIVNAVILTIPLGLMQVLNNDYWNYFFCQFQVCQCQECQGTNTFFSECINGNIISDDNSLFYLALYNGYAIYFHTIQSFYLCSYSSIIGLLLGTLFFIFVPNDVEVFKIWWVRGRIVVAMIILSIVLSLAGLLSLMRGTLPFAIQNTNYGCAGYESLIGNFAMWSIITCLTLVLTFIFAL